MTRRVVLGLLAVAPVGLGLTPLPSEAASDSLVLHRGWVLRTSDIERLGLN